MHFEASVNWGRGVLADLLGDEFIGMRRLLGIHRNRSGHDVDSRTDLVFVVEHDSNLQRLPAYGHSIGTQSKEPRLIKIQQVISRTDPFELEMSQLIRRNLSHKCFRMHSHLYTRHRLAVFILDGTR